MRLCLPAPKCLRALRRLLALPALLIGLHLSAAELPIDVRLESLDNAAPQLILKPQDGTYRVEVQGGEGGYREDWTVFWMTAHFLNAAARFHEMSVLSDQ